jgi:hypothetical protein
MQQVTQVQCGVLTRGVLHIARLLSVDNWCMVTVYPQLFKAHSFPQVFKAHSIGHCSQGTTEAT